MSKQRIGTTISMKNSGVMVYPSLTFCELHNFTNPMEVGTLTHTPDLTNFVTLLQAYDRRDNSTFIVTPENREADDTIY